MKHPARQLAHVTTACIIAHSLLGGCATSKTGGENDTSDSGDASDAIVPLDVPPADAPDSEDTQADFTEDPDVEITPDADATDDEPDSSTLPDVDQTGCSTDADCDSGICVHFSTEQDVGVCLVPCAGDSNCPPGFDCVIINVGGGTDSFGACIDPQFCADADADDHGFGPGCAGDDCDETNSEINSSAPEVCNLADDDCDGLIDNNPAQVGDDCSTGFAGRCGEGRLTCEGGSLECAFRFPPSDEICDLVDNDCNGVADDRATDAPTWYIDTDGDRFGSESSSVSSCARIEGYVDVSGDCDDTARGINPAASELCDGVDNDCNGEIDGIGVLGGVTLWRDFDGDGFGDPAELRSACGPTAGYVSNSLDCDDLRTDARPGGDETCNGLDDDCDDQVDELGALNAATWFADEDLDGFGDSGSGQLSCSPIPGRVTISGDCDDDNGAINPDAIDVCDSIDNNCNGQIDDLSGPGAGLWYADGDGDGWGDGTDSVFDCNAVPGRVSRLGDCDDTQFAVNPDAIELCNGLDDNCFGGIDEAAADSSTFYADLDDDGFGDSDSPIEACTQPENASTNAFDCDDARGDINPVADEYCNGVDDNCSLGIDEPSAVDASVLFEDGDGDAWGNPISSLLSCYPIEDYVSRQGDCDDSRFEANPDATEICNSLDDDCDREVDNGAGTFRYADADGDGRGTATVTILSCDDEPGFVSNSQDCDDTEPQAWTGRAEVCDELDNDCNGLVDEDVRAIWYLDSDSDGFGTLGTSTLACFAPENFVGNSGDCDDSSASRFPANPEVCDSVDNNCNFVVDEGVSQTFYLDFDGDTYGDENESVSACSRPTNYVSNSSDCDDNNSARYPGRAEVCDGLDNNCGGGIDEGADLIFYRDADRDGRGDALNTTRACTPPAGYVELADDCNDAQAEAWTGRAEICDSIDNNCSGSIDEGVSTTYFRDADNDTFGTPLTSIAACAPVAGYVLNSTDCDDTTSLRSPALSEVCDSLDNNCNGIADDGAGTTWYVDNDRDGYGASTIVACVQPPNTATRGNDCNDANINVNPGAQELCSTNYDDNCSGSTNESSAVDATWWFFDADGDGQGAEAPIRFSPIAVKACTKPADYCPLGLCFLERIPYVGNEQDCDDTSSRARVGGGSEVCDGYDNDCNGTRDDGFTRVRYYEDNDGDGLGGSSSIQACTKPIDDDPSDWTTVCCDPDDG